MADLLGSHWAYLGQTRNLMLSLGFGPLIEGLYGVEEPLRAQDMRLPAFDVFGALDTRPLPDSLVPEGLRYPDGQLTPRSRLTKRAWQRMDRVLAESGVRVDVLQDQRLEERGERPMWFQRVCRAHSRMQEILKMEDREARERRLMRERAQPCRGPWRRGPSFPAYAEEDCDVGGAPGHGH